jgi:hypothetical protein
LRWEAVARCPAQRGRSSGFLHGLQPLTRSAMGCVGAADVFSKALSLTPPEAKEGLLGYVEVGIIDVRPSPTCSRRRRGERVRWSPESDRRSLLTSNELAWRSAVDGVIPDHEVGVVVWAMRMVAAREA